MQEDRLKESAACGRGMITFDEKPEKDGCREMGRGDGDGFDGDGVDCGGGGGDSPRCVGNVFNFEGDDMDRDADAGSGDDDSRWF